MTKHPFSVMKCAIVSFLHVSHQVFDAFECRLGNRQLESELGEVGQDEALLGKVHLINERPVDDEAFPHPHEFRCIVSELRGKTFLHIG